MSRRSRVAASALARVLPAAGRAGRLPELADLRGLEPAIARFCADRSRERNAGRLRPERDVARITPVGRGAARLVVDVRTFFEDRAFGRGSGREPRRSGGGACRGFAERRFTSAILPDGRTRVLETSGEQRAR